ncbi:MAG TPA: AMP-binding protein, partial [Kofleriaceae bacterium]|nr:AMP-binding protein [Kofleriaceae bacterium]
GFLRWMQNGRTWRWTYAEAAARVAELCAQLRATGVARGDRVVIYTAETVPSLVFDLACAHLGAVFAPFDTRSTPALLDLCQRAEAAAVLTTLDRAAEVRDEGLNVLALGRGGEPDDDGPVCPALSGDAALAELARLSAPLDGDAIYMLQPTSGTTGGSKLVMRPHKVFTRVARLLGADLGLAVEPAQRVLLIQAMTHGFGQYLLAAGLSLAGEFCVTSQIDTAASLDEIRELDPTYVGFTPRVIRTLVQQNGGLASGRRLLGASTRTLLTGGAKADDDLLRVIHDQGVHVIEAYGASEFSLVSVTRPGQYEPGWVGPVLPDVELRPSAEGELLARTPAMMPGYFGAPELTRAAFTEDGFYRTGDRVEIDERGMLRYLARERDMFNLFDGSNISPTPGEERMAALPWVDQVVLLGDQRPFVVALVVPHARLRGARAGMPGALRRQVELDVGRLNAALEPSARIRRVALLDAPLAAEHYQIVAHGKMRRVRPAIAEAHADAVAALYATEPDPGAMPDTVIEIPGSDGDRRRNTRQSAAILLLFQAGEELWLGTTLDISRSGLLAESQFAPPIGRRLTVELIEPGDGPRRLRAEVVRHEPGRGFAVQFVDREQSRQLLGHRLPP